MADGLIVLANVVMALRVRFQPQQSTHNPRSNQLAGIRLSMSCHSA